MPDLRLLTDLAYGDHPRQRLDVCAPTRCDGDILVVCIPGGWWSQGRDRDLLPLILHLAEHGRPAAAIGSRPLGDGARNGAELLADARAAILRAVEEASLLGAAPRSVALLGSGSGSLLALALAHKLLNDPQAGVTVRAAVACGVTPSIEPWEGCPLSLTRTLSAFGEPSKHSPMQMRPEGFPPLLLLHGDKDVEVPLKSAQKLHDRIVHDGGSSELMLVNGAGHQFIERPDDAGLVPALERIRGFLGEHAREPEAGHIVARE